MTNWQAAVILVIGLVCPAVEAGDWPHWRGPTRNGLSPEDSGWKGDRWLPEQSSWQVQVGEGSSSPLVVGDTLYAVGYANRQDTLHALDVRTGQPRWQVDFPAPKYGRFHEGDEGLYSGPSSTPEYDPATGYLYTLGIDGDLRCLSTKELGKTVWQRNLYDAYAIPKRPKLTRAPRRDYGYTANPYIHGDWLIVEVGSATKGTLAAFDKTTGEERWWSALQDEAGHTGGPAPITIAGQPCLAVITMRHLAVISLAPESPGKTVATFPWVTDFANTIASPAVQGDSVLITAAYNHNALCRVRITPQGAEEVWRVKVPSKVCTPVIHQGSIYLAWQKIRCLNWETGDLRWEGNFVSDPGSCIVTQDERVIVFGHQGKLVLVEGAKRSPDRYTQLAERDRLFRSHAWPHVVLASGTIFCRDREGNLAAYPLQ